MESFEARHSNHDLAQSIAGEELAFRDWIWVVCPCTPTGHGWRPSRLLVVGIPGIPNRCAMPFTAADEIGITLPSLRLDSQAKYGALSRGDASVFMRFPDPSYREKIWDHCAGVIILQVGADACSWVASLCCLLALKCSHWVQLLATVERAHGRCAVASTHRRTHPAAGSPPLTRCRRRVR